MNCLVTRFRGILPLFLLAWNSPASAQTVWGFADLHAHPASNFGFGADSNGRNGLFWGIPMTFTGTDSILADLPPCDPSTHDASLGSADFKSRSIHGTVIQQLDSLTNLPHGSAGAPGFASWPNARSIEHQQMHISSIRRAFDGGLRLMIADATDNQLITRLWRYNGETDLSPDAGFDAAKALPQLQYIRQLAAANATWMQVVQSPAEARAAIGANKLAIILGVEMDYLRPADIDMLYKTQGVRHVIPIHLANNDYGSTAAFSGTFNSNSHYLNSPYTSNAWEPVTWDSCVNFQFKESDLTTITISSVLGLYNWPNPVAMDDQTFKSLNYAPPATCGPDQANGMHACGVLNPGGAGSPGLLQLMEYPLLLLDVAHMSQTASAETLTLAEQFGYPVMDSHTGIRDNDPTTCLVKKGSATKQINERSLPWSQAQRIAKLGGVVGLGTATDPSQDPVGDWFRDYQQLEDLGFTNGKGIALGTDTNGFSWQVPSDSAPLSYPITLASSFGPAAGVATPPLCQYATNGTTIQPPCNTAGVGTFNFPSNGIAVYGMLPDFLAAVNNRAVAAKTDLHAMFHTAEDVIEMWETAGKVSPSIPCGAGNKCCGNSLNGFCSSACVPTASACPGPPPPPCPSGQKCCGGDDGAGHCLGACIASTANCTNNQLCPSGQHCCTGVSSTGVCVAGCVANSVACKPLCTTGNNCCGGPKPNGACDGACIKSPPATCQ